MASLFSVLTAFVGLLAVTPTIAAPLTEQKRAIDSDLFARLNLFEQYAGAAYCANNNNSPTDKVTCQYGNCPLVESATTTTVTEFQNSLKTDVTGFVATDDTNKLTVVAFRGSASIKNWIANLDFGVTDTDICDDCSAHSGFWDSWVEARDGVLAAIKSASDKNPDYKLVVTGHSLGGAIATLAAAELRKGGYEAALYTYGAPRIASPTLSDFITNQPGGNYRVTHYNDPVPRLPPIAFNFVHISPEYYIDKKNDQTPAPSDISVLEGNVNYDGNTAWILTDVFAHGWYFNSVAECFLNNLFAGR